MAAMKKNPKAKPPPGLTYGSLDSGPKFAKKKFSKQAASAIGDAIRRPSGKTPKPTADQYAALEDAAMRAESGSNFNGKGKRVRKPSGRPY